MKEHVNLFALGDFNEIYASLQRDFKRDQWIMLILALASGVFLTVGWTIAGVLAGIAACLIFLDNSNRNWAMHTIDYMESSRQRRNESR